MVVTEHIVGRRYAGIISRGLRNRVAAAVAPGTSARAAGVTSAACQSAKRLSLRGPAVGSSFGSASVERQKRPKTERNQMVVR
jgi:hypothetical protein